MLYIPCSSEHEASTIATSLVQEKLVACCNLIPSVRSFYLWAEAGEEQKLCEDTEVLLIAKSSQDKFTEIETRVKELHSYTCPCIVALSIEQVNQEYENWLNLQIKN